MSDYKSTRDASSNQERQIAKKLKGKKVANSGATKYNKGDVIVDNWLIEAKTCMKPKKSFSIKKEWLEKNKEEMYAIGKDYSALCFDFGDNKDRFYIIDENTFSKVIDLLKE